MDPNAFVYCQKKGKLERKKIKKLKEGDIIVAVTKGWTVKMVRVNSVVERILPSSMISRYTFKNGNVLITSDQQRLTRLYNVPHNEEEPLNGGTYMTFSCIDNNRQIGMTEIYVTESLNYDPIVMVRVYGLNCEDENKNLMDGIIVNGVPVCSFNMI